MTIGVQKCFFFRFVKYNYIFIAFTLLCSVSASAKFPFVFGVASGDPDMESVVLWTALPGIIGTEVLIWECSEDSHFNSIYASGTAFTDLEHGGTVKTVANGLKPSTTYYYRFLWNEHVSPTGKTKTAPAHNSLEPVKLAIVSCAHFEAGYFYGYAEIAKRIDIDVVVHLGDYIYEYEPRKGDWTVPGRKHIPDHEIISLSDYRQRYAQYRLDTNLQAIHAAHPMIAIWDDHEIANNSYRTGAANHQGFEGEYQTRRDAALKAYYEWMPVRENKHEGYRAFRFGQLLDLILMETRVDGRTKIPHSEAGRYAPLENHHLMSDEQRIWVRDRLLNSSTTYRVLGNQTIFSPLELGILPTKRLRHNLDAWDGYVAEREHLSALIPEVAPVVIITGDSHCSWGFEGIGFVELCTPSITSTNIDDHTNPMFARLAEVLLWMQNKNLEYVNVRDHGFLTVEFTQEAAHAEWTYVKNIKSDKPWRVSHRRRRSVHPWTKNLLTKTR